MEAFGPLNGSLKRYWRRRRRSYQRLNTANRRNIRVIRVGGTAKRSWRIRIIPKLRMKIFVSPVKLWTKFKNGYMNMLLNLAGNISYLTTGNNAFGGRRIPKARNAPIKYSKTEFENRLIYEIYKTLDPSMELYNL